MIYTTAQIDRLAAEYVLGTLYGPARRRFDRLMNDRADVRSTVWRWERDLNVLAEGLEPQKPPRRIWKNILRRTQGSSAAKAKMFDWVRGLWLAIPAAAAAAWIAIILAPSTSFERIAVVADADAETRWVISVDVDGGILETKGVNAPDAEPNTDFELWILAAEGPPLSLGVLPTTSGPVESRIPAQLIDALGKSSTIAISVEPTGGSQTGLPTGPVVYTASLLNI